MTATNKLCTDVGWLSVNHYGEQLCGDHVEIIAPEDGTTTTVVLADGLGSGVKASILSTLTSKILSTMLSSGLKLEYAVQTLVETLPVCSERQIAYSTFTIIRIVHSRSAEIIQYDNPKTMLLRNGVQVELPFNEFTIGDKTLIKAEINIKEDDVFLAFSDGIEHAGIGNSYNFGWKSSDIAEFMAPLCQVGYSAKSLSTLLINETEKLYDGKPADDATACVVRIRRRVPVNLIIGPPSNRNDCNKMMSLFFGKEGKHIICGGTTSSIASEYLKKPIFPNLTSSDPDIPPIATMEGADLVTEGVITINRVLEYARDCLADNASYEKWRYKKDGASLISRTLFEEATDINFFVGKAINPAHQNEDMPINFNIKMQLVKELAECLKQMGKRVKVIYF